MSAEASLMVRIPLVVAETVPMAATAYKLLATGSAW